MSSLIKFLFLFSLFFIIVGCSQKLATTTLSLQGEEFTVEIVDTLASQKQGLSNRQNLAGNSGMLFVFEDLKVRSFWMKDMNFPLDIIWLVDDKIIGWKKNAPVPQDDVFPSYKSPQPANQVLEISAGLIEQLNLEIGDIITINL
ncbi:DUF192 domain-containing protein [bacterium]|jgi:hypothetical protein|nr:DUF192 domain-containing protein [bacterium]